MKTDETPSLSAMMGFLTQATGRTDDTMTVSMWYCRHRYQRKTWEYRVRVKMCGSDDKVYGRGATLEKALLDLLETISGSMAHHAEWYQSRVDNAKKLHEEATALGNKK